MRPGELHVYWGRADRHSSEDVVFHNGPGTHHCDGHLLHSVLGTERAHLNWDAPLDAKRTDWVKYEPSLLKELEDRGYDLMTLRFYIRKKSVSGEELDHANA